MIKVADIIEESQVGGPQIRMSDFANQLNGRLDTTLIMPVKNSFGFIAICEKYKLKYKTFNINKISKNYFLLIKYLIFFFYEINLLRKYFLKEKFNLIHVSGGAWQFKGIIAARLSRIPVIWHINDTYMPKIIKYIFKLFSSLPNAYIFASHRSKMYYEKYIYKDIPFYVVPASVDTNRFNPDIVEIIKNDKHELKKIVIGTVANISPVKGLENIIETAIRFKHEENIEFKIVGNISETQNKYFNRLKNLIRKNSLTNIHFYDFKQDIRYFLKNIDIYLCTSNYESSPIAVWEAMSMKKPVVSNDVGDVSRHIKNHFNGIIIKNNSIFDIFESLKFLINDREKRKQFGINARQTCKNYLETSVCANNQLEIFKEVVNKKQC